MVDPDPDEKSDSSNSWRPLAPRANEDMYYNAERYVPIVELENRQQRKQLVEATKCKEELARLAAKEQAPPQDTQAPPPQDTQVQPRRPRGRPRKNAATRRAEQAPPPTTHPVPPRPRRSNRPEGAADPPAEAQTVMGNNRSPLVTRTPNPGATQNVPEPDRSNSGPSRPHNGRQPPSPIRNPPSPIRHPLLVQWAPRPVHQDRDRQAGRRHGNEEATQDCRIPQPTRSQMSRSQTVETRRPAGNPSRNNRATSHVSESSNYTRSVSIYNPEPRNDGN
ncbi:uncharacterized protein LOC133825255 [Humulus lupulus]|uniref:uncharacterized protein LOC133825255 n=1 Tax=Humulus lupulus TaxID=3486 RepID=UPI002B401A94|nr:uncharacterized protein LOC133825255 [Humulus lupulus]